MWVPMPEPLTLAIGRTARTKALFTGAVADPALPLDLPAFPDITRAFAPMVREGRFPSSEIAIATFLMAKSEGAPLVLLPCVLLQRFQDQAMFCRADSTLAGPPDLRGKRIGVRAYSQTTGMWLRGILQERYGIAPDEMRWITYEDAHVASFRDPPFVERAKPADKLADMLLDGRLDAAIFGAVFPPDLRPVFPDAAAAAADFRATYGFMPVNHLVCMRADVAQARAAELPGLLALLRAAGADVSTRAALNPALAVAARFCTAQGLTPRTLSLDEIWAGTPTTVE